MAKVQCPICERPMDTQGPAEWPDWPFCSHRCRLADLNRWFGQRYAIPDADPPPDADESLDSRNS